MNDVERAERIQAWKAFLIPSTLFVACLMNAAGIYIIYTGSSVGVIFLGLGFAVIIGGLFAFVTFQNTRRAGGQWKQVSNSEEDFSENESTTEADDDETAESDRELAGIR